MIIWRQLVGCNRQRDADRFLGQIRGKNDVIIRDLFRDARWKLVSDAYLFYRLTFRIIIAGFKQ